MPDIKGSRSVDGPPFSVSWERREYLSPDGQWSIIYHTPREWHMGADGWQVKLLHHGSNVAWKHRGLMRLPGSKGFRRTEELQPWSYDSKALVFVTWDEDPVHIYDIGERSLRQFACGSGFVHSVQWNPLVDRLLVTSATGAVLTDRSGNSRGTATWTLGPFERPHSHWMKDGKWFFIVARESARTKSTLTFYAGEDAAVGETHELDPLDLVPYDADEFRDLPREGYCLVIGPSSRSVGESLDTWARVEFHQPSATLYLSVYRPVSAVFRDDAQRLCKVEERWVAVELVQ